MNTFPIPEGLASKYHGSGHALAAVKDGRLIDIVYMHDLLADFDPARAKSFIGDQRLSKTIKRLAALGDVSIGMCSCWEFCEL